MSARWDDPVEIEGWRPPRRDDDKGDQFPDAPAGVREPRKPKPRDPSGAGAQAEVPAESAVPG